MRRRLRILLALSIGFFLPLVAWIGVTEAQSFHAGGDITIPQDQTVNGTLWAGGNSVDVAGTVNGDVFCGAQNITISGTVNGDVICGGQTIDISGKVNGDVRVGGQTVSIGGKVSGSATIGAQTFTLDQSGSVGRDLSVGGTTATLNGTVGRDVLGGATTMVINNTVARNVTAGVTTLRLNSHARVGGNLQYTSNNKADIANGAVIAGTTHRSTPQRNNRSAAFGPFRFLFGLYMLAALLFIALVFVLLLPRPFFVVTDEAISRPWWILLTGFVASIFLPIIFIALFFTVIGIPLALLLWFIWFLMLLVSGLFFSFYIGRLILRQRSNAVVMMLLGSVIVLIALMIPFFNILVFLACIWFGTGMMLTALWRHRRRPDYAVPAAVVE